ARWVHADIDIFILRSSCTMAKNANRAGNDTFLRVLAFTRIRMGVPNDLNAIDGRPYETFLEVTEQLSCAPPCKIARPASKSLVWQVVMLRRMVTPHCSGRGQKLGPSCLFYFWPW